MTQRRWKGDYLFVLENLVLKDFRIRYRNMSLGILWSLINPLVMMGVLTFIFGHVYGNQQPPYFPLFILCGQIPYHFFTAAWLSGTVSVVVNAPLVKRVPRAARDHSGRGGAVQLRSPGDPGGALLALTFYYHLAPSWFWLWLLPLWMLYIAFVCGVSLLSSAVSVFIRDTQYVVESFNVVLFWLVPIFYSWEAIPQKYAAIYRVNPVAALALAMRNILIDRQSPPQTLIVNMVIAAAVALALGLIVFGKLKRRFYEYI